MRLQRRVTDMLLPCRLRRTEMRGRRRGFAATACVSGDVEPPRGWSWSVPCRVRCDRWCEHAVLNATVFAADVRDSLLAQLLFQLHVLRRLAERCVH